MLSTLFQFLSFFLITESYDSFSAFYKNNLERDVEQDLRDLKVSVAECKSLHALYFRGENKNWMQANKNEQYLNNEK